MNSVRILSLYIVMAFATHVCLPSEVSPLHTNPRLQLRSYYRKHGEDGKAQLMQRSIEREKIDVARQAGEIYFWNQMQNGTFAARCPSCSSSWCIALSVVTCAASTALIWQLWSMQHAQGLQ